MYVKNIRCTVLVIGAGPTGLMLACDLARRGLSTRLIEAAALPFTGSRGKGVQPRTLEIFDDLGVIAEILASGAPYPKLRTHMGPFSVRAGSLGTTHAASEAIPYPNLWMVPQARTEEILRARLATFGVAVELDTALVSFVQDDAGVSATLSTGEVVRTNYLVGCDGAHSVVRKTLALGLVGETLDDEPIRVADVEVAGLSHRDWHIWPFAKGGVVGLCPMPHSEIFQFTAPASERSIERMVRDVTGHEVTRVAWSSTYRHQVRMVDRYRVGRVFLAGDAAHIHPPAGGQGLNTGVQDAYNLGWKLALVSRGAPDSLLDTYEEERLPIAAAVLGLSKQLHRARSIKRGDATNQLALHYRGSSLSSGPPHGALHAGDRMHDCVLSDGSRLFTHLRGSHATALTIGDTHVLVRPDGYIAAIGAPATAEYFGGPVVTLRAG